MALHLPSRAVIREIWKRQLLMSNMPNLSDENFDDAKMGIALAWPRMMVTTEGNSDVFDVVTSLLVGILSEKPATSGNGRLGFALVVVTLRRNGWMLDISNDEVLQVMARIFEGKFEERHIALYFRKKSIPQSL